METIQNNVGLKTTPRDFSLYLWITVSLYISAISLIGLVFAVIDRMYPGTLMYIDPYSTGVRTAIATLVVIFPIFILVSRYVYRMERETPQKRELGIRKWLTYLNLFIGGLTLIIDLIVLLNRFLGGTDFTTGFILKALSVLIIVGGLFAYYTYDLRNAPAVAGNLPRNTGIAAIAIVALTLVIGFIVMGSPATQRARQYDDRRVNDLSSINYQVINYWQLKRVLPKVLSDVENKAIGNTLPADPEIGSAYVYQVVGPLSYKLCATFALANTDSNMYAEQVARPAIKMNGQENWSHEQGEQCFTRTIDPDLYPVLPKGTY